MPSREGEGLETCGATGKHSLSTGPWKVSNCLVMEEESVGAILVYIRYFFKLQTIGHQNNAHEFIYHYLKAIQRKWIWSMRT